MNIIRYYYFLTCLKIKYTAIYRIKFIVAHIICYNIDNVNSFRKYYHDKIPEQYYEQLSLTDGVNLYKYKNECLPKNYSIYIENKYIDKALLRFGSNDPFYGNYIYDSSDVFSRLNMIQSIKAGRYEYTDRIMFSMDEIDIYVFYILFKHKKFDIIDRHINKLDMANGYFAKYTKINKFIEYIIKPTNYKDIMEKYFNILTIDILKKHIEYIFITTSMIVNNISLTYEFILLYGIEKVKINKFIVVASYEQLYNLYEKKIITLNQMAKNHLPKTVEFLLKNNIKPNLIEQYYTKEIIMSYINKYGTEDLSMSILARIIDEIAIKDPERAILIGWNTGTKFSFYKYIDKNIKIKLEFDKICKSYKIVKYYVNQFKKAGIKYNNRWLIENILDNSGYIDKNGRKKIMALGLKNYLNKHKIFKKLFKLKFKSILFHIIDKKLVDLKIILTYACYYRAEHITNRVVKKETFCYICGHHK